MGGPVNVEHPRNDTTEFYRRERHLLKAELEWEKARSDRLEKDLSNLIDGVALGQERYGTDKNGDVFYFVRSEAWPPNDDGEAG